MDPIEYEARQNLSLIRERGGSTNTFFDAVRANFDSAADFGVLHKVRNYARGSEVAEREGLNTPEGSVFLDQRVSEEQFKAHKYFRPGMKYDPDTTEFDMRANAAAHDDSILRNAYMQGTDSPFWAGIVGGLAGGMLMPENYVASVGMFAKIATVAGMSRPVVSLAEMMAKKPFLSRVAIGAGENVVATAITTPFMIEQMKREGQEVLDDMLEREFITSAIFGGVFGGIHGVAASRSSTKLKRQHAMARYIAFHDSLMNAEKHGIPLEEVFNDKAWAGNEQIQAEIKLMRAQAWDDLQQAKAGFEERSRDLGLGLTPEQRAEAQAFAELPPEVAPERPVAREPLTPDDMDDLSEWGAGLAASVKPLDDLAAPFWTGEKTPVTDAPEAPGAAKGVPEAPKAPQEGDMQAAQVAPAKRIAETENAVHTEAATLSKQLRNIANAGDVHSASVAIGTAMETVQRVLHSIKQVEKFRQAFQPLDTFMPREHQFSDKGASADKGPVPASMKEYAQDRISDKPPVINEKQPALADFEPIDQSGPKEIDFPRRDVDMREKEEFGKAGPAMVDEAIKQVPGYAEWDAKNFAMPKEYYEALREKVIAANEALKKTFTKSEQARLARRAAIPAAEIRRVIEGKFGRYINVLERRNGSFIVNAKGEIAVHFRGKMPEGFSAVKDPALLAKVMAKNDKYSPAHDWFESAIKSAEKRANFKSNELYSGQGIAFGIKISDMMKKYHAIKLVENRRGEFVFVNKYMTDTGAKVTKEVGGVGADGVVTARTVDSFRSEWLDEGLDAGYGTEQLFTDNPDRATLDYTETTPGQTVQKEIPLYRLIADGRGLEKGAVPHKGAKPLDADSKARTDEIKRIARLYDTGKFTESDLKVMWNRYENDTRVFRQNALARMFESFTDEGYRVKSASADRLISRVLDVMGVPRDKKLRAHLTEVVRAELGKAKLDPEMVKLAKSAADNQDLVYETSVRLAKENFHRRSATIDAYAEQKIAERTKAFDEESLLSAIERPDDIDAQLDIAGRFDNDVFDIEARAQAEKSAERRQLRNKVREYRRVDTDLFENMREYAHVTALYNIGEALRPYSFDADIDLGHMDNVVYSDTGLDKLGVADRVRARYAEGEGYQMSQIVGRQEPPNVQRIDSSMAELAAAIKATQALVNKSKGAAKKYHSGELKKMQELYRLGESLKGEVMDPKVFSERANTFITVVNEQNLTWLHDAGSGARDIMGTMSPQDFAEMLHFNDMADDFLIAVNKRYDELLTELGRTSDPKKSEAIENEMHKLSMFEQDLQNTRMLNDQLTNEYGTTTSQKYNETAFDGFTPADRIAAAAEEVKGMSPNEWALADIKAMRDELMRYNAGEISWDNIPFEYRAAFDAQSKAVKELDKTVNILTKKCI